MRDMLRICSGTSLDMHLYNSILKLTLKVFSMAPLLILVF
jgi:hypothetical protein